VPMINGRYYMNPQYAATLERVRTVDEESVRANGTPQPSWLDRFLGLVPTGGEQEQISRLDINSSDIFSELAESGDEYSQRAQNQPATGEGSQANLDRRAGIAAATAAHEGDTSMPYMPGRATCNLFVQKAVAESGAPKPLVRKADGRMGAPSAAELAGDRVPPGWRILKPGESPQPGDIAARKEHFADATGHSGVVVSVKNGAVTAMAAHQTVIGKDMSFQPSAHTNATNNVFLGYTGE
jgi:hypothetical protein